jgi:hypothetical protein
LKRPRDLDDNHPRVPSNARPFHKRRETTRSHPDLFPVPPATESEKACAALEAMVNAAAEAARLVTPGIYKANRKAVEEATKQTAAYLKAIRETMHGSEIVETFRGTLWPLRIKTPRGDDSYKNAFFAFHRAVTVDGVDMEIIIEGYRRYAEFVCSKGIDPQYIKTMAAWLGAASWDNELWSDPIAGLSPFDPRVAHLDPSMFGGGPSIFTMTPD